MRCRGIVVLVIDTLRHDFQEMCQRVHGVNLPSFQRLRELTTRLSFASCGSFPTLPMRTDLLTGKLAFLSDRWASPRREDPVITVLASQVGYATTLITDNYVIASPTLGGHLTDYFERSIVIRGMGSDPWQPVEHDPLSIRRRTRSEAYERQFISNLNHWDRGDPPYARVFKEAAQLLNCHAIAKPYLLWIDSFALHEPWRGTDLLEDLETWEPVFPPYDRSNQFSPDEMASLWRRYGERVIELDRCLQPLVDALQPSIEDGSVDLLLLSDHGFLLGEYGYVGKPYALPVLPALHKLVAWVTPHLIGSISSNHPVQPMQLTGILAGAMDIEFDSALSRTTGSGQVIGRNSPFVDALTVATRGGAGIFFRDETRKPALWLPRSHDDGFEPFEVNATAKLPSIRLPADLLEQVIQSQWGKQFHGSLAAIDAE